MLKKKKIFCSKKTQPYKQKQKNKKKICQQYQKKKNNQQKHTFKWLPGGKHKIALGWRQTAGGHLGPD